MTDGSFEDSSFEGNFSSSVSTQDFPLLKIKV